MNSNTTEAFPCPPNLPPGDTLWGKIRFAVKNFADLQTTSVMLYLKPWLQVRRGRVAEVGCGAQPYRHFLPDSCEYIGIDWRGAGEHFGYVIPDVRYYDGAILPLEDDSCDSLYTTEVIEHVYETTLFLSELHRVLRPNGFVLITIPFQARYHYGPYDYWRITESGLFRLMDEAGFVDVQVMRRGNDVAVAAYKVLSLVYRWLLHGNTLERILGLISGPIGFVALLIGHFALRANIGSTDDCLGYVITGKVKSERV